MPIPVVSQPLMAPTTTPVPRPQRMPPAMPNWSIPIAVATEARPGDRADREVDLAGAEHEGHRHRHDRDHRGLADDVEQVVGVEEALVAERRGEDEEDHHEADIDDVLAPVRERRRFAGRWLPCRSLDSSSAGFLHELVELLFGVLKAVDRSPRLAASSRSWRAMSRTMRPSDITRMRSQAASSSGSSDESTRIALPALARSRISVTISDFEPMSMPAVGSSRISTSGSVVSHLAMTTFCGLPPDSVRTVALREAVLMRRRWIELFGQRRRLAAIDPRVRREPVEDGQVDVAFDRMEGDEPLADAVLRHQRDAGVDRVARLGDRDRLALDRGSRRWPSARCRTARAPATSGRCPAGRRRRPPRRGAASGRHRAACAAPETPRASSSGSPSVAVSRTTSEKPRERRPTICSIIVSSVNSDIGAVIICRPSRRMVARSAMRKISSMRCET